MGGNRQALQRLPLAMDPQVEAVPDGGSEDAVARRPFPVPAQAGLEVGAADDVHEHEADAIADAALARLSADDRVDAAGGTHGTLRRRAAVGPEGGAVDEASSRRIEAARGGGAALPPPLRHSMEAAFDGADFSRVRLHADGAAADLSANVGAHAFTIGRDVFLGGTAPSLDSREGQHTLAHELAHTLQPDQTADAGTARRKLADTDFSAKTLSDKGLGGGFRMRGQSKFSDLGDLLDEYQQAPNRQEELRLLGLIVTKCDAWSDSSFRDKKHSKSKKVEEQDKSTEVARIRGAAVNERDDIMATMDDSLAGSLPADQQADGLARTLSRYVGISVSDLLSLSDDEFRSLYIERVYIESVKAKKGAKGSDPAAKKLSDLVFTSKDYDFTALDDGPVKDLIAKIRATKLDNNGELGQLPAPALAGSLSSVLTPEGMTEGAGIQITGNQAMLDKTKEALDAIASTQIGKELFRLLAKYGVKPDEATEEEGHEGRKPAQVVAKIWPSALATATDVNDKGDLTYGIAAGPGGVGFDPNSNRVGSEAQADKEEWRKRDASVALFHELIHVLLAMRKKDDPERWDENGLVDGREADGSVAMSDQGDMTECRIVGVAYETKLKGSDDVERTVKLPFNDAKQNPLTENQFRLQLAKVKLEKDDKAPTKAFLRPGYSDQVKAQTKLTSDESVIDIT
jgi:hypothetical protein